jgi:hypothetical protein
MNSTKVLDWLRDGVDIYQYFQHFKGSFKGNSYNCATPPPTHFQNHKSCEQWANEIARQLEERIRNGSLELLGRVGQVEPPTLVMPLVMVLVLKRIGYATMRGFLTSS